MATNTNKFRETDKYVFFHGATWPSQWHKAPMIIDGVQYNCCEQYMMAMKAKLFKDNTAFSQIMKATEPREHKKIGRKVKNFNQKTWDKHKNQIITDANYAKFSQNKKLKKKLLAIGSNKIFVEASTSDKVYGIGLGVMDKKADNIKNWRGQNLLGYAITNVRDRLLKQQQKQNDINDRLMNILHKTPKQSHSMDIDNDEKEFEQYKKQNVAVKRRKGFLVLGGSFSPCHTEHVELLNEIKLHLEQYENISIVAAYLVITTDGYVMGKLGDAAIKYKHRHKICALTASKYPNIYPSHIAQVNATSYARNIMKPDAFKTFFPMLDESEREELAVVTCCGADWIRSSSISSYKYSASMSACIARKGYNEDLKQLYDDAKKKGECKNFVYIDSECKPISSTLIRTHMLKLRDALCKGNKNGEWRLRKNANSQSSEREKQRFRDAVKDMLHSDVIEYVIKNIADLWIVPKHRVVGGDQPHGSFANDDQK